MPKSHFILGISLQIPYMKLRFFETKLYLE